jgi:NIMA (never in mitosis gene a)-related kinase
MLVLKIIAGDYPPVPSHYSAEIKALLGHCLQQDPNRRFTIEQVLDFPIVKAKARQMGKKLLHEEPLDDSVPPPPPPEEEAPESLPPPPPTKSVSHEEKEGDKKPSVSSAGEEKATPTPPVIPPPKQDPARNLPSSTKSDARPSTKSQLPALPNQNEAKEMPKATHDSSPNKAFPSSQTKDEEKKPALTSPNARNSVKPASTSQSNEAVVSEAGKSNTVSNSPFNPKSENDSQKKQSVSPVKRGSGPVVMPSSEIFKEAPKRPAPTKPAEKEKVDVAKKQVDEAEAAKVNKAASPGSGLAKRNSVKALVGQFSDEPSPQIAKVTAKPESPLERKSLPASAFSKEKKLPAPPSRKFFIVREE